MYREDEKRDLSATIRKLSSDHWTPVNGELVATKLLVTSDNDQILDIGSGCGKFRNQDGDFEITRSKVRDTSFDLVKVQDIGSHHLNLWIKRS